MTKPHPTCDCTWGKSPCRLYPMSRVRGRTGSTGRCEGCAAGIHKGHATPLSEPVLSEDRARSRASRPTTAGEPARGRYKVTDADGSAMHGGTGRWRLNRWRSVRGPLVPCENGLHLVTLAQLPAWLGPVIWEAEYTGEIIEQSDKMIARRARVTRRVEAWNERTARLFAADCAEHVLPIFEKHRPNDARPREAIAVVRRFANGEATREDRAAAWDAAGDAAWDAAGDAARAAAWAAARAAAGAAAWDAAGDAARAAAWDAAGDAARAAARAAAGAAELKWQAERLAFYLDGGAS